jgi:large subunit ribosomal protein L29
MKFIDIKDKTTQELTSLLKEKRTQLFTLKIKQKTMQLQNTSELRGVKKEIARVQTAINAKRGN